MNAVQSNSVPQGLVTAWDTVTLALVSDHSLNALSHYEKIVMHIDTFAMSVSATSSGTHLAHLSFCSIFKSLTGCLLTLDPGAQSD